MYIIIKWDKTSQRFIILRPHIRHRNRLILFYIYIYNIYIQYICVCMYFTRIYIKLSILNKTTNFRIYTFTKETIHHFGQKPFVTYVTKNYTPRNMRSYMQNSISTVCKRFWCVSNSNCCRSFRGKLYIYIYMVYMPQLNVCDYKFQNRHIRIYGANSKYSTSPQCS